MPEPRLRLACFPHAGGSVREAGLITTCRDRNTVLHALTPLGVALLQSDISRHRLAGL